jgi:esterase/lipase
MNSKIINIRSTVINSNIPTLICCAENTKKNPIIIYHAFLQAKESMLQFAYQLAKLGYFAVCIDINRHGDRKNAAKKFPWNEFFEVVFETAEETSSIINHLEKFESIDCSQISVLGVSLGGLSAFSSALSDARIKNIITLLSTGNFMSLAENKKHNFLKRFLSDNNFDEKNFLERVKLKSGIWDPYYNIEKLTDKNIFMINGEMDFQIPISVVKDFQQKITETSVGKNKFLHIKSGGHYISKDMADSAMDWARDKMI